jgi:RimJ/RimL family protein N-acetyltransferase
MNIKVRELAHKDIDLIANYWLSSPDDFLIAMGVDLSKIPPRDSFKKMLEGQLALPYNQKQAYALIWELDGKAIGHSNVNAIEFGKQATMHLHLWHSETRKKGLGTALVKESLAFYFSKLAIEKLYCEPYALNPAPNKTLAKIGFEYIKTYQTIPGSINFEQEVKQWSLSKEQFKKIAQ